MPKYFAALALSCLVLAAAPALALSLSDAKGEPTVYATVVEAPDKALVGCFARNKPTEFNRPNSYEYCLIQKGDKYAVYYYWRDGKTMERHEGWMPFTIHKERLESGTEPSAFILKDGAVWHNYGGRDTLHKMRRTD